MHPDRLHYEYDFTNPKVTFIQTVKENEDGYTQRYLEQARLAKDLYDTKIGHPSQQDFKAMVAGGVILNCLVTVADVIRAKKIYGPSIAALKGKTVRSSPEKVVTDDSIEVPKQILEVNPNVALSADVFCVNTIPFFTSISWNLKLTTTENIPTRTARQLVAAFKHVLAIYKKRGFDVETALMDGEFTPLIKADILEMGVHLNIISANEHVPEIERRVRVIKERSRSTRHNLPFTYIPKAMVVTMVGNATAWINAFPPKGGVSSVLSPRTVLTEEPCEKTLLHRLRGLCAGS